MRIQLEAADNKAGKPEKKAEKPANVVAPEDLIEIGDFAKIKLKTAKVLTAERVEGADKLLKLSIEVGSEKRPLVAGVAQYYTPEEMVGKTIVIVANLKPAVIRGVESCGMLLAAKAGKRLSLVTVEGDMPSGASIG
jgi:methionyl-tRNA synthetase